MPPLPYPAVEESILRDNNLLSIKHTPEYATNKDPDRSTNRVSTSLFISRRKALAITQFNKTHDFGFDAASLKDINKTILKEYLDEASGRVSA